MLRKVLSFLMPLLLIPALVLAQDGKLRGRVTDKESGEPLIGANVLIEGTTLGASSDVNGEYVVLSIPVGTYTVKVSYIGYAGFTVSNIRVNSNITTSLDVQLTSSAIQVNPVEIVADRPLIQRNTTNTVRLTTQEDIKNLPFRGVERILALNAGVVLQNGNLYIRGGRLGEVAYVVDGASVTNPLFEGDNRQGVSVIQEAIEEIQLQSGGFTAEAGGANSGVVRTTVRTGGSNYKFSVDLQTDDLAKPGKKFLGTSSTGYRNFVFTVGGPVPMVPQASFFVAAQHTFQHNRTSMFLVPFRFGNLTTDKFDARGAGVSLPGPVEFKENYIYRNWNENNSAQGSLVYNMNPFKFNFTGSYSEGLAPTGDYDWPTALVTSFWQKNRLNSAKTSFANLRVTHILGPNTFYQVGFSYYKRKSKTYDDDFKDDWMLYADSVEAYKLGYFEPGTNKTGWLSRRSGPNPYSTILNFSFRNPYAPVNTYDKNNQTSFGLSLDYTSQINPEFELKAGGKIESWIMRGFNVGSISALMEFIDQSAGKYNNVAGNAALTRERDVFFSQRGAIDNYGYDVLGHAVDEGIYRPRKPILASAYVQNKFEFRDLILNIGARFEYFDQDAQTVENFVNPPWDPNLNYFANPDSQIVDSKSTSLLLPRISFSFPVTDRTVFYAQYGKYAQLPSLNRIYSGAYLLSSRISPISRVGYTLAASPAGAGMFIKPERTTQYEMGFRQKMSENVAFTLTGFYKDERDKIQIRRVFNEAGVPIFASYKNDDFATNKGLEITFDLRRTNRLAARLNYTLSDARGTASTAISSRNSVTDDNAARFPQFITPLDYDQTHRGTIMIDYRWGRGEGGPALEGFGANVLLTFNSGHAYTKILEPLNLGQASVWNIGVRPLIDSRTRNPVEPINASSTPWVFNIDLNVSKVIYLSNMNVEVYVNVLNLLNTKQVINLFNNTGTPTDDGWLRSPLSASYTAVPGYSEFYKAINIDNRYSYIGATGNDVYGPPRQLRVGVKVEM